MTAPTMLFPGNIQLGSSDPLILRTVKSRLNELGYGPLSPEISNFGLETRKAVMAFQRANHLIQDGIIGELTWARLFKAVKITDPRSGMLSIRALEVAKTQLYVREATNHNDGVDVEKYLRSVGLQKGDPWCMAALYWSFNEAARHLNRKNPVPKTGGVLDCLERAKAYVVLNPSIGDQFIMNFGRGKGHTGIIQAVRSSSIFTVEGNTSADPSLSSPT